MDAKPRWREGSPVRISMWRIRELRRQSARQRDKQTIETLGAYIKRLEEELYAWREWYFEQAHGEGSVDRVLSLVAGEQQQQQQQRQGLIDYSKWDKLSCSSSSSDGVDQLHDEEEEEEKEEAGEDEVADDQLSYHLSDDDDVPYWDEYEHEEDEDDAEDGIELEEECQEGVVIREEEDDIEIPYCRRTRSRVYNKEEVAS